jgi:hypothetical protein
MHPLDGAYARVARAEEHIDHLERLADEFGQAEKQATRLKFQDDTTIPPGGSVDLLTFEHPETPVPDFFGVLIGESLYNLRTALDYLIFELAALDSGADQAGTQFPIFDHQADFARRGLAMLPGVSAAHRARIEGAQPYQGPHNDWLALFRTLSNRDKHRELRPVVFATDFTFEAHDQPTTTTGGSFHVKVHFDFMPRIAFAPTSLPFKVSDSWPPVWVIPSLREFAARIRDMLDSFKPDF